MLVLIYDILNRQEVDGPPGAMGEGNRLKDVGRPDTSHRDRSYVVSA